MGKVRISATIEESTLKKLKKFLRENRIYRNNSHAIEDAIEKFVGGEK